MTLSTVGACLSFTLIVEQASSRNDIFIQCHIQKTTPTSTVDWVYWSPKSTQITPFTITQASVRNGLSSVASLPKRHVLMFHWKVRGVCVSVCVCVCVSVCAFIKVNICPPISVHVMYASTTTPFHDLCVDTISVWSGHYHFVGKLQALSSQWRTWLHSTHTHCAHTDMHFNPCSVLSFSSSPRLLHTAHTVWSN